MIGIKRDREDDIEIDQYHGEAKRPRALPLRSSPTSQHCHLSFASRPRLAHRPQTLTPAESEEDESDNDLVSPKNTQVRQAHMPPPLPLYIQSIPPSSPIAEEDVDMDMGLDSPFSPNPLSAPVWSPQLPSSASLDSTFSAPLPFLSRLAIPGLELGSGKSHGNIQTARIPTPIYGYFSSAASLDTPSDTSLPTPPNVAPPTSAALPHPRIRTQTAEYSSSTEAFFRRRALPSPISEDENMDSPTMGTTKHMMSNLKMSTTPSSDTFPQHAPPDILSPESPPVNLPGPCFSNMGNRRRRSDAVSNGNGEGKVVFSMGFRADCEKCRERVPGHYSHVIRG